MNLALNKLRWLICHKIELNPTKPKFKNVYSKKESGTIEMHTHRDGCVVLLWNLSAFRLSFARVEIFPGLYHFLDSHANSCGHTSRLRVACGHASFYNATIAIYWALPLGNNLRPVYFTRQMHFLLCRPSNLCGISTREQPMFCFLLET